MLKYFLFLLLITPVFSNSGYTNVPDKVWCDSGLGWMRADNPLINLQRFDIRSL